MTVPELAHLFPTTVAELPKPRSPVVAEEQVPLSAGRRELARELLEEMRRDSEIVVKALEALAEVYRTEPETIADRWRRNEALTLLLHLAAELPPEVASGPFKIGGLIPRAIDSNTALRFQALLLVYAARAIFFAERRGIDGLLSGVHARIEKYEPHLSKEGLLLLEGFSPLFSLLSDPPVIEAFHRFAQGAWRSFPQDLRALMCLGTSYDLLLAWGQGGRSQSQRTETDRAKALRTVESARPRPWWRLW
jgi:hypothetical protein